MESIEVLSLGACLLRAPISELVERNCVTEGAALQRGEARGYYYTLDEAIQALNFYRGVGQVPKPLRMFCSLNPDWEGPAGGFEPYGKSDVALVEINSPTRISYGSYALSRADISDQILSPLADMSEELHLIGNDWYYRGIGNCNEELRAATAEKLAAAIPDDFPNAELARSILLESRFHRREVKELIEGLATVRDIVGAPLGVLTYTYTYMPDGRPMPWPPNLVEQTIEAARMLDLPVFDPSRIVSRYGVKRALSDDTHYQVPFHPILAGALFPFIHEVRERGTRSSARSGNRWANRWRLTGRAGGARSTG